MTGFPFLWADEVKLGTNKEGNLPAGALLEVREGPGCKGLTLDTGSRR